MKIRIGRLIYDQSSELLANGDLKPSAEFQSINAAKRAMRRQQPARAFESYKAVKREFGVEWAEAVCGLLGLRQPSDPPVGAVQQPEAQS